LEDVRVNLAALGLVKVRSDGEKHWALVHDILGRFLINALFYDFAFRQSLGFEHATDAEHLRFLLLRQISHKAVVGEKAHRSIGEEFATAIFKIDPAHGHSNFTVLWREVLDALDTMPRSLRDTSRVFRHHTAISRRRITTLDERYYGVVAADRRRLLNDAVADINYALNQIDYTPGSESNLNLYNSLANVYFDLAKLENSLGSPREVVSEWRRLANEATRRAYEENPTNSFVIETYVKNILHNAQESPSLAVDYCVEALGLLFSALASNEATYRASQLGSLADQALEILFQSSPVAGDKEPTNAVDLLIGAWAALTEGQRNQWSSVPLSELPDSNRHRALKVLENPIARGNMQVIRLRYDLLSISKPFSFGEQLDLVQQLQATDYKFPPQLRLEFAILLYQVGRAAEGEREFRTLRRLWRESEQFVQVPERLRWLRAEDGQTLQSVTAILGSDYGSRAMARVSRFGNALVPFRPEEHGMTELRPGTRFVSNVSFGHNGPFLRPLTAQPARAQGE